MAKWIFTKSSGLREGIVERYVVKPDNVKIEEENEEKIFDNKL